MLYSRKLISSLALIVPSLGLTQVDDDGLQELQLARDRTLAAPVTLDDKTLFRVRGISAVPAYLRAQDIRRQIVSVARDESIGSDSGRLEPGTHRIRIIFGDTLIVTLFEVDAELEHVTLPLLAEGVLARVGSAIQEYRESRSAEPLLRSTLVLGAMSLVAGLLVFGILKLFVWTNRIVYKQAEKAHRGMAAESRRVVDIHAFAAWSLGPLRLLRTILVTAIVLVWLNSALSVYPWTRPFASRTFGLVFDPLRTLGSGLLRQVPNLAFILVLALVVKFVLGMARRFFQRVNQGTVRFASFDREWAMPTYRIARLLILAFTVVVAYPYIPGSNSEAFKGVSIFLGVVLSIGSSSFIASMIAGYSLIYRRAFRKGDRVKIGDMIGDVVETRVLSTQLKSTRNELINIPNATVLSSEIINFSSLQDQDGLILHTTVGIGYDIPWRLVEQLLLKAAAETEELKPQPPPFVLRKNLGDFYVTYELNVYCDDAARMTLLYSALHTKILDLFSEAGIQIMSPHYEADPPSPKVAPRA